MAILYLEPTNVSDVSPYSDASNSDSSYTEYRLWTYDAASSDHPVLLDQFLSVSGYPNVTGTYAKTVVAEQTTLTDVLATVFKVRVDVFRYKTTGTIANITEEVTFNPSWNIEDGEYGEISRTDNGSFVTDGFTASCIITVSGSATNDGDYLIVGVTERTLQVSNATPLPEVTELNELNFMDVETVTATISTKEKLLCSGLSNSFSNADQRFNWTVGSFSETFANDDRIGFRVYAHFVEGNSHAYCAVLTEGDEPFTITLS